MKPFLNPFKKAICTDPAFLKCEKSQADFVDREILVQQLMLAYIRDVRNLEVFISPDVREKLFYSTDPNGLWDFCTSVSEAASYGVSKGNKKGRKYLGFIGTGLFLSLSFVSKDKRVPITSITEWVEKIEFTEI
jgi:hypothetical protein